MMNVFNQMSGIAQSWGRANAQASQQSFAQEYANRPLAPHLSDSYRKPREMVAADLGIGLREMTDGDLGLRFIIRNLRRQWFPLNQDLLWYYHRHGRQH